MIDFDSIKISLQEWLVRSSGLLDDHVIYNDQSTVRPDKPYIIVKILSNIDIGEDARGPIDDEGNADFVGNRELTISISYFGGSALNSLSRVRDSLNNPNELAILRSNSIIFVDQLFFEDVTELLETEWEERAQLDILFRTSSVSNYNIGFIEGVEVNGTYKDCGGNIIVPGSGDIVIDNSNDIIASNAIMEIVSDVVTLLVAAPTVASDPYMNLILASNPIGYFRLNNLSNVVFDESTTRNHGTVTGTLTQGVAGALNNNSDKAINFVDAKLDFASHTIYTITNKFTIEFWIKQDDKNSAQYVLEFENNKMVILYEFVTNQIEFFAGSSFTGSDPRPGSQIPLSDANWHHIAYTYDGVTWSGILDGVSQFSVARTFSITGMPTTLRIGQANNNGSEYEGSLDEVVIYDEGLSLSTVLSHYDLGISSLVNVVSPLTPKFDFANKATDMELSFDALTVAKVGSGWNNTKVDKFISITKVQWEVIIPLLVNTSNIQIGVVRSEHASELGSASNTSADKIWGWEWWGDPSNIFYQNGSMLGMPIYTSGFNAGDVVQVRMDPIGLTLEFSVNNGAWALAPFALTAGGSWTPVVSIQSKGQADIDFGDNFTYPVSAGYTIFKLGS